MRRVVISQPMFFPWVGMYEQLRLADVYVHYSDVQFSKGSFVNRVQIKTASGMKWMTVPLADLHLGQRIDEIKLDDRKDWRSAHKDFLRQTYRGAPYVDEMLSLVEEVYAQPYTFLDEMAQASLMASARYFGLESRRRFTLARDLGIGGDSSQRVFDIVQALEGTHYITGHGARNYLDHELFERAGIRVEYLDYRKIEYRQMQAPFTPYVSILDLIANEGKAGVQRICSPSLYWKDFLHG